MQIPHAELLAPASVVELVASIPEDARVAAVFGRAKDFDGLRRLRSLESLWLSGIREKELALVGELRGLRKLVIHDLRVASLEALAPLAGLTFLRIAGSPKLKSLAGLERLTALEELILFDCCNYGSVAPLAGLSALETLCLEGGFSKALKLDSLEPLARLTRLRRLRLASLRVEDRSLRPLHGLGLLREVFVAKMFPESELRVAAAALPLARGQYLDAFRDAG